jgi:2-hydroxyethylphosphonate dioxygenase
MNNNKILIDSVKFNYWLNLRKTTVNQLSKRKNSLKNKINTKKNFIINNAEIEFIEDYLKVSKDNILFKHDLPKYIFWSREMIIKTKRSINRGGIHFYNYYSLPTPKGFVGPVILDILCPKNKIPDLNNGHLEQAITVNLGPADIFGRWGKLKTKNNFSKIKANNSGKNSWIIGDTYVEPTYCPHSYSRATNLNSQILSYTAKSPIDKFVKNLNLWSNESYKNFVKYLDMKNNASALFNFYLLNRCIDFKYISNIIKKKIANFQQLSKNKKNFDKICSQLGIDSAIFVKRKYNEDGVGKSYLSYIDSFETIRRFKSYQIASMASSIRYPDLFGLFISVNKKNKNKDLIDYAASHYLVTSGILNLHIDNKIIKLKKGDALWTSSFVEHGFDGIGSLIKISNGECMDTSDIFEISKIYNAKKTLVRSYQDKKTWGYE